MKVVNNKLVAILLATYNGEKFLVEQLDSLMSQSFKDFNVYVHDDGSTDSTCQILDQFCSRYDNIFLLDDPQNNRGAKGSFEWLLENVESNYYMFCDQDDFWLKDKVTNTLTKLREIEIGNKPAVLS